MYPVCNRRYPLDLSCGTVNLKTCNGLNGREPHVIWTRNANNGSMLNGGS